jgi:hypothetical protein
MHKCTYCGASSPSLSWDRATADEFLGEGYSMDMIGSISKQEVDTIHICPSCKADTIIK